MSNLHYRKLNLNQYKIKYKHNLKGKEKNNVT